jgi:uncharacterized protein with FMN-binding domain
MTSGGPPRIPVRGSLTLALTAGGVALLLGFRHASVAGVEAGFSVDANAALAPGADDGSATGPSTTAGPSTVPDPSPTAVPSANASAVPSVTAESTAVGDAISFRFGTVQVEVTVADGHIVAVQTLQMPDEDRHSLSISREVEPMLRESALAAGDARIDVISGATYTSLAYAQSLQSALDQLGA